MQTYQQEQLHALNLIRRNLTGTVAEGIAALQEKLDSYLSFREEVDRFLEAHFSHICTESCYKSRRSACCSKDGVITFFADAVINFLESSESELKALDAALTVPHAGTKCIYLGDGGCLWHIRPLVCAMFLCDQAEETVFVGKDSLQDDWQRLKQREKSFRWPDRPVLFDDVESVFLNAGCSSPLMYLHLSPGLLKVKQLASASTPAGKGAAS
jgi:hypothetical protein